MRPFSRGQGGRHDYHGRVHLSLGRAGARGFWLKFRASLLLRPRVSLVSCPRIQERNDVRSKMAEVVEEARDRKIWSGNRERGEKKNTKNTKKKKKNGEKSVFLSSCFSSFSLFSRIRYTGYMVTPITPLFVKITYIHAIIHTYILHTVWLCIELFKKEKKKQNETKKKGVILKTYKRNKCLQKRKKRKNTRAR